MDYIKEKLYQQLAIDYCCQVSDIKDDKNHFTEYEKLEGSPCLALRYQTLIRIRIC